MKKWDNQVEIDGELYDVVEHTDKECEAPRNDGQRLAPFSHGFVCLYQKGAYKKWCGSMYAEVRKVSPDPQNEKPRRWIVCAAIRGENGDIICGPRHFDGIMRAQVKLAKAADPESWRRPEQGFVDQFGNFLTREEALEIALANGQRRRRCGGDDTRLFSENLY